MKDVIDFIIQDDELKQLLYYTEDPLSKDPSAIKVSDMIEKHVFPYLKNPNVEDDAFSFINVYMYDANNAGTGNIYQKDVRIFVDVICHESLWNIEGLSRPLLILDDLDTKIPDIETIATRGTFVSFGSTHITYNQRFSGYRLIYGVTNQSKNCGE